MYLVVGYCIENVVHLHAYLIYENKKQKTKKCANSTQFIPLLLPICMANLSQNHQ